MLHSTVCIGPPITAKAGTPPVAAEDYTRAFFLLTLLQTIALAQAQTNEGAPKSLGPALGAETELSLP
jgi:hypothetical protein